MGIKALSMTAIERFVSPFDPGHRAICTNQDAIDAWDKSKAKNKGDRPEPEFRNSPESTFWHLGTLSSLAMSILQDEAALFSEEGSVSLRMADNDVLAARMAIRGWDNFDDEDGPVAFETETVKLRGRKFEVLTEALAARIPIPVLRSIGQHAKQQNSLDAIQAKNSDSASSPSNSSESVTVAPAQ